MHIATRACIHAMPCMVLQARTPGKAVQGSRDLVGEYYRGHLARISLAIVWRRGGSKGGSKGSIDPPSIIISGKSKE